MAIKGLTDHGAIFPQVGIIRKGAPKPERGPGRDMGNHFRFVPVDKAGDAHLVELFQQAFPFSDSQPQRVRFYLPFPVMEENWQTWREEWKATALVHRCDGEIIQDPPDKRGQLCPYYEQRLEMQDEYGDDEQGLGDVTPGCKQVGRLKMVIRELGRLAYTTFITTSLYDLRDISGRLAMVEMLAGDHDLKLTRVPMILTRYKTEINYDDPRARSTTGKTKRDVWLCSVMPDNFWQEGMLKLYAPDDALSLPSGAAMAALPDGRPVNASTGEIPPEEPEPAKPQGQPSQRDRDLADRERAEGKATAAAKAEATKTASAQRISKEENRQRLEDALTGLLEEGVELSAALNLGPKDIWLYEGQAPADDRALLDLVKKQANAITVGLENIAKKNRVAVDMLPKKPDPKAPGDVQADYRRALGRALIATLVGVETPAEVTEMPDAKTDDPAADAEATATEQAAAAGQLYQAGEGMPVPIDAEAVAPNDDEIPF
jgi:hypothetical protein